MVALKTLILKYDSIAYSSETGCNPGTGFDIVSTENNENKSRFEKM